MKTLAVALIAVAALLFFLPEMGLAQGMADANGIAGQNLRGYTHMFIAYFIAWTLVVGWVVSIARRLGRIERALKD
jgi:CcmD family protein